MWIGIIIAVILLLGGFYLYFYYPETIPGLASVDSELKENVNVLVIGMDDMENVDKGKIQADSIMLIELEPNNEIINFNSLSSNKIYDEKMIKNYSYDNLQKIVSEISNKEIDYYFKISYNGFINIVDQLDGIDIELKEKMNIPDLNLSLQKGLNHLNGKETLNYARWYNYQNEQDRLKRHIIVAEALVDKALKKETVLNIPKIFSTIIETYKNIETNIDIKFIRRVLNFIQKRENIVFNYDIIDFK